MEKIRFGTSEYELLPSGYHVTGEQLRAVFVWPDKATYEGIEASLTGCDRIEVLSESGDLMEAIKGYTCVHKLRKQYDYIIGMEQVESGQDEDGNPLYINQDVTGTVMVATLKMPDVRAELEKVTEELTTTQAALAELYESMEV